MSAASDGAAFGPYADAAARYLAAGWPVVVPCGRAGQRAAKAPVPAGVTGYAGSAPDEATLAGWLTSHAANNIALVLPPGVVGIDVDDYGDKRGGDTLAALEAELGPLPPAPISTARPLDSVAGIRFYRLPERYTGLALAGGLGPGIDVIAPVHRYALVAPSVHPHTGTAYVWLDRSHRSVLRTVPTPDSLRELPQPWCERLVRGSGARAAARGRRIPTAEARRWLDTVGRGRACRAVRGVTRVHKAKLADPDGSHYDAAVEAVWALLSLAAEGHRGIAGALSALREQYLDYTAALEPERAAAGPGEWSRMVRDGIGKLVGEDCDAVELHPVGDCPGVDDGAGGFEGGAGGFEGGGLGEFTDAALTDRLAAQLMTGQFLWARGLGWLGWDGRRWAPVGEEAVTEAVRVWVRGWLAREAEAGAAPERITALVKLGSRARISALTALARGATMREASELDAHPELLNCPNGVLNLATGELRGHDDPEVPGLLLSKLAGANYAPGASSADWTAALDALDEDVREYFLDRMGQALTGYPPPDDKLLLARGSGENGKSTVLAGLSAAFGEYAGQVPRTLLLADAHAHPTDLMTLHGLRLAYVEELPEARKLSVARLKETVGTEKITARLLYKDFVSFRASHALLVNTNYLPTVAETDHGTWRRLERVEFPYTYKKARTEADRKAGVRRADVRLRERIISNTEVAEAVLADLAARARAWFENDRRMAAAPARVDADTLAWRGEDDTVMGYARDRLVVEPGYFVLSDDLLADLNEWLGSRRMTEWSARLLVSRFSGHDAMRGVTWERARTSSRRLGQMSRTGSRRNWQFPERGWVWNGVRFASEGEGDEGQ